MSQTIDLSNGESVFLTLNGQTLNIKSDGKNLNFIVSTLDNSLALTPDSRNKIFISAEKQKNS
ncbi:MAG: hypothetical protein RBT59_13580 [Arcobacteraceae bacterium]|jgi:hypothetical protein|nr:hypothetical protein [Arcobacteraceae bacterium]